MEIFDSHAHLDQLEDLPGALREASAAGVCGIMAVGVDLVSSKKILEIKKKVFRSPRLRRIGCPPWRDKGTGT